MQLKMLDCADIPNDNETLSIHLPKTPDTDLNYNSHTDEYLANKPEQIDPGPTSNQTVSIPNLIENLKDEENYDQYDEFKIRIGEQYQIDLSSYIPSKNIKFRKKIIEKETPIWLPSEQVENLKIDNFLKELSKCNYFNIEHALSILFKNNYDTEKAIDSLRSSDFNSNEWTKEDKVLFEQGLWYYGKNFHRINQLLPHKTHANLVSYYYKWKKTRNKNQHSIVNIDAACSTSTNSSETFGESNDSNADCDI